MISVSRAGFCPVPSAPLPPPPRPPVRVEERQALLEHAYANLVKTCPRLDHGWLREPNDRFAALRHVDGHAVLIHRDGDLVISKALPANPVALPDERVAGDRLELLMFGDTGTGEAQQMDVARAIRDAVLARPVHFAVHVGDIIYPHGIESPKDPQISTHLVEPYRCLPKLYLAPGNHDHGDPAGLGNLDALVDAAAQPSNQLIMPARYYSFSYTSDATRAEFFVTDSSVLPIDLKQLEWLERAVARSTADWRIVVAHHPLVSHGEHGTHEYLQAILPRRLAGEIDLYACGHEHDQQVLEDRSGILVLVTGAAGATSRKTGEGSETRFATSAPSFSRLTLERENLRIEVLGTAGDAPLYVHERVRQGTGRLGERPALKPHQLRAAGSPGRVNSGAS